MWHFLHCLNDLLSLSGRFENGVAASVSLFTVRAGSPLWPHDVRRRKGLRYSRLARRRCRLTFKSLLVTWCTNKLNIQQLYALSALYLWFVFIWEQTATCATYSISWLVFTTEMKSVYCAVRIAVLNQAVCASSFKG